MGETISTQMLRALTSLLLFCFSFQTMAPALFASSASSLPACCKRAGKHHCARPGSSAGEIAAARCPRFPQAASVPANANTAPAVYAGVARAAEFSFFAAAEPDHGGAPAALRGPVNKRGPPSF